MKPDKVTFGVEIECLLPTEYVGRVANQDVKQFIPGHHGHGRQIVGAPKGWTVETDGSVHSDRLSHIGVEVVSPILKGTDGLTQLVAMVDYLAEIKAAVIDCCGLHVHIGKSGVSESVMVDSFVKFEKAFFASGGTWAAKRYNGTWCKPWHRWDGSRYASLNVHNAHTYEVRCFSPSLDAANVVAAVVMTVGLITALANGARWYAADRDGMGSTGLGAMQAFIREVLRHQENQIMPMDDDDLEHLVSQAAASSI